jgi:hypothetical protein
MLTGFDLGWRSTLGMKSLKLPLKNFGNRKFKLKQV